MISDAGVCAAQDAFEGFSKRGAIKAKAVAGGASHGGERYNRNQSAFLDYDEFTAYVWHPSSPRLD